MYRTSNSNVHNNILSIARSDLLIDWDYEKNASICSPDEVTIGSKKEVWWKCHLCGAEYYKKIVYVKNGHGCKACGYKRTGEKNSDPAGLKNKNSETVADYPEIAKEWDYEKNSPLTPSDVTVGSNKKMWWICPKGHSYSTIPWNRIKKGSGCTICIGKKVLAGFNDLATLYPDIASEFHPTKNGSLTPDMVAPKSHKKLWWKCSKGHEWESIVSNRTGQGRGCPYCAGQKVIPGKTDLETVNPKLALEWNYEKNGSLKPTDVSFGSNKEVWWRCDQGHEWKASIKIRNSFNTKCPYCPHTKTVIITKGVNDFASRYPELAKDWHPTKNGDLTPEDISYGSGKKVWWICKNGHEYQMTIHNKSQGRSCPVCGRRRRTSFPEQAFYYYIKQVYPDAVNSYKDIFKGSMELDIYIPSIKTGIEYDGIIYHNSRANVARDARKYQICKENGIRLIRILDIRDQSFIKDSDNQVRIISQSDEHLQSAIIDLIYHLGKFPDSDINLKRDRLKILEYLEALDVSLESEFPEIAKEFHLERNGNLKPSYFHPGSNERVWWKCSICGYEWQAKIIDRTGEDKNGCPICAAKRGGEKIKAYHLQKNGSLADTNPELLPFWNYERNTILPSEIVAGTPTKVWWRCEKGHEWESAPDHVSRRGLRCPYCSNKRILKGYNDLATINPKLAQEWHPTKNGDVTPFDIGAGSGKKVWWKCSKCGNEWQSVVYHRNNGVGCPNCDRQRKIGNQYAVKKNQEVPGQLTFFDND